jgi:cytochrome c oxidase subunit 3
LASTTIDTHGHHPRLQHQFDSLEQQKESSTLGMWMFLVTEIMFFGGLFTAYVVYRMKYPHVFAAASYHLNVLQGGINTAVLICSSLTMALAIWAAQVNKRKLIVLFLIATMALGTTFLFIKGLEYHHKFEDPEHPSNYLVPGAHFSIDDPDLQGSAGQQAQIFFSLYFIMTGIHALHMIIGLGVLAALIRPSWKGRFDALYHTPLECTGLYWHFVDIVWLFLFPLLYLLGAHAR